jgi:hypothetical protein
VNTFGRNLQLSALNNLDLIQRLVAGLGGALLDLLYDIVSLEHLAEDDVTAIEPAVEVGQYDSVWLAAQKRVYLRGNDSGDEELGAVCVLAGVGHGKQTRLCVLELEVLVGEAITIDLRMYLVSECYYKPWTGRISDILDLPPVPSPLVKSPPWIMNCLMTLWKVDPS